MSAQSTLWSRLEQFGSDLRSALHALVKDKSFSLTAVATLALAIGINITAFAVMNATLLRGFPVVEVDDQLLYLSQQSALGNVQLSYPDFEAWRDGTDAFEGMAFLDGELITFSDALGERRYDLSARRISFNTFSLLGVPPALGRDFVAADESLGAPGAVILSHRFWQNRFGGREDILGHTVGIDDGYATVIGVMPAGFDFPERENLWMPLRHASVLEQRQAVGWAVGRLTTGATQAGALAELETIDRRRAAERPEPNRDLRPRVLTFSQFFIGPDAAQIYLAVWAAGCFVLLIACANLANLALARNLGRWHEFSTRIALGAARRRLAQLVFGEWLLLACIGGLLGWWLAKGGLRTWADATNSPYRVLDYTVDDVTLAYAAAITLVAACLVALAPISRVIRLEARGHPVGASRGSTPGRRAKALSRVIVAGQMTLAIVLLCGAGVLVRSFWNVVTADAGIEAPADTLTGFIDLTNDEYPTPESQATFFSALQQQLENVRGVESVSIANVRPVDNWFLRPLELESEIGASIGPQALSVLSVGAGYFHTIGASTLTGREFDARDRMTAPLVTIVNEAFVDRYFPGEVPIGRRVRYRNGEEAGEWRTIVGVVSNIMQNDPTRRTFLPLVYVPFGQEPRPDAWFFARTRALTDETAAAVQAEVQSLNVLLRDYSTLEASFEFVEDRMDLEHLNMGRLAAAAPIFAATALILASLGLYSVLARAVGWRKREIGLRMAVGATQRNIWRLVVREELGSVAFGLVAGLLASLAVNQVLRSQLVDVAPYDPVTMIVTSILLVAVALLACHLPARRAMRIDPAVSLRED